jgi:hypothetical protein
MNFSQLHERLRIEVLRRIESGSLTATLLARQIHCSPAHVSNFLSRKRRLSLDVLDKVLEAQFLTIADLYPEGRYAQVGAGRAAAAMSLDSVPLVEPSIAASQARIHSASIIEVLKISSGLIGTLRDKCSAQRRKWDRFVAIQIWDEEVSLMQPSLPAHAIVFIDRHYNSTFAYAPGGNTIYAVRIANRLRFRYVTLLDRHLVMRTLNPSHAPELLALSEGQTSADLLVGRVFLTIIPHY